MRAHIAIWIGAILVGAAIVLSLLFLLGFLAALLLVLGVLVFAVIVAGLVIAAMALILAAPYYILKKPAGVRPESSMTLEQIRER